MSQTGNIPAQGHDLIVIGGGMVGSAIAWGAVRLGCRVALLDEGDVAFRAARGNFGLIWVQSKGSAIPHYARISRRAAALWPRFASELRELTGIDVALQQTGGVTFCLSEAELEARQANIAALTRKTGCNDVIFLDRSDLKSVVPIGDSVVGGTFCASDGHVNPLLTLRALQETISLKGAYFPGSPARLIEKRGRYFVVRTSHQEFVAEKLVICAGLASRELGTMVGLDIPVSSLRGQILVTERMPGFLPYATHVCRQTGEGSVLLGDSHEDVGLDTSTTVPIIKKIAERAIKTFPLLGNINVVRAWGALRVMTPDASPIYNESKTFPGAFVASVHSGVTLASFHALKIVPAIVAGKLPDELSVFSSARFHA